MTALVIGEALVDIVRRPDGSVVEYAGGSPANVSIALARLGRDTTLATSLAHDRLGDLVRTTLAASGVRLRPMRSAERTSSAMATIGDDGAASYVFDLSWDIDLPKPDEQPLVVHTGSIGAVLDPGGVAVLALLEELRAGSTVTYDLNVRPAVMRPRDELVKQVEALVGAADVVKASDEDLEYLYPGSTSVDAAANLLSLGPAAVLVTTGGGGAVAVLQSRTVSVAARPATVADTIGAGDTFMAGTIDALWALGLLGADTREALRSATDDTWRAVLDHAAAAAAVTVSRPGADPPWRAELPALVP